MCVEVVLGVIGPGSVGLLRSVPARCDTTSHVTKAAIVEAGYAYIVVPLS